MLEDVDTGRVVERKYVMARKLLSRTVAAAGFIGAIHVFMVWGQVPSPEAWILGAIIYAALIAVMLSSRSLIDKCAIYAMFVVIAVIGGLTICPCTHSEVALSLPAGLITLWLFHIAKRVLPAAWSATTVNRHPETDADQNVSA